MSDTIAQLEKILNLAKNRGFPDDVTLAALDYILNHHYFDIDSYAKLEILIDVVFEILCPLMADDERSCVYLTYLTKRRQRSH